MDETHRCVLDLMDQAFDRPAWHGPNLLSTLRGLSPQAAAWRPAPGRHSPWEIALHCAYWKHRVRQRIAPEPQLRFPRKDRNWPRLPDQLSAASWRADLALLKRVHAELRVAVVQLSAADLKRPGPRQKRSRQENLIGIACHDLYHAGQVRLITRILEMGAAPEHRPDGGRERGGLEHDRENLARIGPRA